MTKAEAGRPRAVVCLSGGMDSCVCAALAARDYDVYAIHFSYGQRTEARELRSAQEVARIVGARELMPLKIDLFRRIGGSALTDHAIAVPAASTDEAWDRKRDSGDLCSVPQRTFSFGGGKLGGGSGRKDGVYRCGGAGQLGVSRLPAGLL